MRRIHHSSAKARRLLLAATFALGMTAAAAARDGEIAVDRLIADLASNEFIVRQQATTELQQAGVLALPQLAAAVRSANPEARGRAWNILLSHALSGQTDIREAARAAVRQLEESDGNASRVWSGGLARIHEAISQQAATELTRLGATIMPPGGGPPSTYNVQIGHAWRGGDEQLALLADLGTVPWLSLENSHVTDAALDHIARLGDSAPGLMKLFLGSSGIAGADFGKLGRLQSLQYLSLKQLPIDDARLATLPALPELQQLGLDGTKVGDAGLKHLSRYPRLQMLWLDNTRVTDAGLAHLSKLQYLDTIYLPGTAAGGPGLANLRDLPNLKSISLKGVKLAPGGVRALAQIERLESLGLDMTNVTNDQLADLAGLKQLRILWLNGTSIGDEGLKHLQNLRSLQIVHLSNTQVTPEGTKELERAIPGCQITVDHPRATFPTAPNPQPPLVQPIAPRPPAQ